MSRSWGRTIWVSQALAEALSLPRIADLTTPDGQQRAFFRLNHLLFRLGDATLDLPWRGKDAADKLPLCAAWGCPTPPCRYGMPWTRRAGLAWT